MFSVPTTDQRRGGAESAGEGQGEGQGEGEGPEGGKEGEKKKKKKDSIASRPRGQRRKVARGGRTRRSGWGGQRGR